MGPFLQRSSRIGSGPGEDAALSSNQKDKTVLAVQRLKKATVAGGAVVVGRGGGVALRFANNRRGNLGPELTSDVASRDHKPTY